MKKKYWAFCVDNWRDGGGFGLTIPFLSWLYSRKYEIPNIDGGRLLWNDIKDGSKKALLYPCTFTDAWVISTLSGYIGKKFDSFIVSKLNFDKEIFGDVKTPKDIFAFYLPQIENGCVSRIRRRWVKPTDVDIKFALELEKHYEN